MVVAFEKQENEGWREFKKGGGGGEGLSEGSGCSWLARAGSKGWRWGGLAGRAGADPGCFQPNPLNVTLSPTKKEPQAAAALQFRSEPIWPGMVF